MKVFPLPLADDAKERCISVGDVKITTGEEFVEMFFYRFYPQSYDKEDEMLDEGDNWWIDPIEFLSNVSTSFKNHKKVDRRTKNVLFHSWMNGNWNKRRIDDSILRSNNATTDSFFKPYLITHGKSDTEKEDEQIIMEYLVNISKRRAFWSLNEDILKINDSDYQYAVSIKEDTTYPCLHSPKTTKERRSIRRIQRRPIRRIGYMACEYSGRYQTWSLLQETPIRQGSRVYWWRRAEKVVVERRRYGGVMVVEEIEWKMKKRLS
ncbi:hypothetical protein Tco_1455675 [Tanacetum coccineum]